MKKVAVLKELPQNLSLEQAEPDLFHDEDNLDLDLELEELESRLAFGGPGLCQPNNPWAPC